MKSWQLNENRTGQNTVGKVSWFIRDWGRRSAFHYVEVKKKGPYSRKWWSEPDYQLVRYGSRYTAGGGMSNSQDLTNDLPKPINRMKKLATTWHCSIFVAREVNVRVKSKTSWAGQKSKNDKSSHFFDFCPNICYYMLKEHLIYISIQPTNYILNHRKEEEQLYEVTKSCQSYYEKTGSDKSYTIPYRKK